MPQRGNSRAESLTWGVAPFQPGEWGAAIWLNGSPDNADDWAYLARPNRPIEFRNPIALGDGTSSKGKLIKAGTGKLTLANAANGYKGTTTVDGGTLAGYGCTNSALTVNSATLAPGLSVGTFKTTSATFGAGSTLAVEVDGATADQLLGTGAINLGG